MSLKSESGVKVRTELRMPKMFSVVMHNDDYTAMDFVVDVLRKVFDKSEAEANIIMLEIHNSGKSIAGTYPYDIAVTKKTQTDQLAGEKGFPLRLTVTEVL